MNVKKEYSFPLLIVSLIFILYYKVLFYGFFSWDDNVYVINNPHLIKFSFLSLKNIFLYPYNGNYSPLTTLSFYIDRIFGGQNPFIYHAHNLVLHILNSILVYFLANSITKKLFTSIVVSLLFSISALHIESVVWISERKDLLYTFYFLISFLCYLKYISIKKKKYYFFSVVVFILSLLSKGQAVILPICLVAYDILILKTKTIKTSLIEKIPFIVFSILFGIITLIAQYQEGYINLNSGYSFFDRVFIASSNLVYYCTKLVFIYNLSIFYPFPVKTNGLLPIIYYITTFVLLIIPFILFRIKKMNSEILFGIIFYLICMILFVQLIPFGEARMADRYTYLSSIGIFIIIAVFFDKIRNIHNLFYVLTLVYLGFNFYQAHNRIGLWEKNIYLFEDAKEKFPNSAIILNNLASIQSKAGDTKNALLNVSEAINIDSAYTDAYYNRAVINAKNNNLNEALIDYSKVIKLNPNYDKAYYNRGNIYLKQEKYIESINDFDKAIFLSQLNPDAYNNRGLAKMALNNLSGAISDFTTSILINPKNYKTYFNRGICYGRINNYHASINDLNKSIIANPDYSNAYYYRGIAKFELGDNGCEDLIQAANKGFKPAIPKISLYCY